MKTAAEYLDKKLPIIPCGNWIKNKKTGTIEYNSKAPRVKAWQKTDFKIEDFKPEDNIGLKLKNFSDVDIDNPACYLLLKNIWMLLTMVLKVGPNRLA